MRMKCLENDINKTFINHALPKLFRLGDGGQAIRMLVEGGADINARNDRGKVPLSLATNAALYK